MESASLYGELALPQDILSPHQDSSVKGSIPSLQRTLWLLSQWHCWFPAQPKVYAAINLLRFWQQQW